MPAPLDPALVAAIEHDIRAGQLSRNAIARTHGVAQGSVSLIARRLETRENTPPAFDRAKLKRATAARQVDQAAERATIRDRLLVEVNGFLDRLHRPARVFNFGGRDNAYVERVLPEPTFRDQRELMTCVGIGLDKVARLDQVDTADDLGRAAIVELIEGLGAQRGDAA